MFDKMFGVGGWRIPFRIVKMKLCETRPVVYVRDEYSLVLEYIDPETNERKLKHFPCNPNDKSLASSSIVAFVVTKVYNLNLQYNRIDRSYKSCDAELDKQLQNNWLLNFTDTTEGKKSVVALVWEKLKQEQQKCPVHQIDETRWPVILWKGKTNGSRAYIWQHVTSELIKGHKIVWYEFTDTRSADHLRQYLVNLANYKEEILSNPAVKGLLLAHKIFEKEIHLKQLSADQRKARRLEEVKPCVDEFFELVHSKDIEKLGDGKLKDALVYARNGEEHLRGFFENGNILLDNGECERRMKPLAILRKNAMFSYTSREGEATAIMFSLIETTKASSLTLLSAFA
ncbi:MAG: transposase [Synergistaceae bacterium]|nr:transposase [Synergistaceae bacterium]